MLASTCRCISPTSGQYAVDLQISCPMELDLCSEQEVLLALAGEHAQVGLAGMNRRHAVSCSCQLEVCELSMITATTADQNACSLAMAAAPVAAAAAKRVIPSDTCRQATSLVLQSPS